jgi:hypothetical protein
MSVWIGLMKPKGVELFVNRKYQAYSSLSVLSFAPSLSVKERERERERKTGPFFIGWKVLETRNEGGRDVTTDCSGR